MKSMYIINPKPTFPTYFGLDFFRKLGLQPKIFCMDLATVTVAAMAKSFFTTTICDEQFENANIHSDADIIAITGKVSQWSRMKELAEKFKQLGKLIIIGGPHASLAPVLVRPYCDILVVGEIDEIYNEIFNDIATGHYKDQYVGGRPDLINSVIPDLSGYPNKFTSIGALQTSRGCPFTCDFCDVRFYNGQRQRHKPVSLILAELENLAAAGYTEVFLADDHFTANKPKAIEILQALGEWNKLRGGSRIGFSTQLSVDSANDDILLAAMANASLDTAFVGIESFSPENLIETGKYHNLVNFQTSINRFLENGTHVIGGSIIGFDHDTLDNIAHYFEVAQSMPIPIYTVGNLVAPIATTLFDRLSKENRLVGNGTDELHLARTPWDTNILPKQMTPQELLQGMIWLCSNLYHPINFTKRVLLFLERYNFKSRPWYVSADIGARKVGDSERNHVQKDSIAAIEAFRKTGPEERKMIETLYLEASRKPVASVYILSFIFYYLQIREMFGYRGYYRPELLEKPIFY
jgi:radical SAM superfamily enzyme YgiQ (UPF0313 family)